jgi:hypothetical protein
MKHSPAKAQRRQVRERIYCLYALRLSSAKQFGADPSFGGAFAGDNPFGFIAPFAVSALL